MSEKDKKDIKNLVESVKCLAENDPQALLIVKSNVDILKARCDLDKHLENPNCK